MFALSFGIASVCVNCGAERDPEGRRIARGEKTFMVQTLTPCQCGEQRIKVSFELGDTQTPDEPESGQAARLVKRRAKNKPGR